MSPHRNHVELRASRKPARQYVSETHDHKPDAPVRRRKRSSAMKIKPETTGFICGGMLFLEPPARWRSWQRDIWTCCDARLRQQQRFDAQLARARLIVSRAEADLGRLTPSQLNDLLLDNMMAIDSDEARGLVAVIVATRPNQEATKDAR